MLVQLPIRIFADVASIGFGAADRINRMNPVHSIMPSSAS
jgi:hypothetical protein